MLHCHTTKEAGAKTTAKMVNINAGQLYIDLKILYKMMTHLKIKVIYANTSAMYNGDTISKGLQRRE